MNWPASKGNGSGVSSKKRRTVGVSGSILRTVPLYQMVGIKAEFVSKTNESGKGWGQAAHGKQA
jgi:hypothetical protein